MLGEFRLNKKPIVEDGIMPLKPKWKVSYLVGFGAMTIHEIDEYYYAWTKVGAWKAFHRHHGKNLPRSYQSNYSWDVMKDDIVRAR